MIILEVKLEKKEDKYSTFDAIRICDVEKSRFFHWLRDGYLPEGELVKWGRGYKTEFNLFDLYSIALFKECVDVSLSRNVAKECMDFVVWDFIIKNNNQFMVFKCKKESVKNKDGKDKIKILEEPEFYENLLEMVYPKHLIAQFNREMAYSEALEKQNDQEDIKEITHPEASEKQDDQEDMKEIAYPEALEEQDITEGIIAEAYPNDLEERRDPKQSRIGFFIDLLKIVEDVNRRA